MKSSGIILTIFLLGLIIGYFNLIHAIGLMNDWSTYVLYLLMFLVGFSIGSDLNLQSRIRNINIQVFVVPVSVLTGTGIGVCVYLLFFSYPSARDTFAIGYGLGYYSLSSILISKISGEELGVIALLANLIREITTLIFAPVYVKYFGKYSPIAAAGATSSDTTLPIIIKFSGKEYVLIAIVNGIVLTLLVPLIINFIYWIFSN